jgi:phage replication initiation protein
MRAIVDWCTVTFQFREDSFVDLLEDLSKVTGLQLRAQDRRSRPGYTNGYQIECLGPQLQFVNFAVIAFGGDSQRGRAMLDLSGSSCGCVTDWSAFGAFIQSLPEARLTRVDTAVDLFQGEFTVDDAVQWQKEGLFNCAGREPSTRVDGDWLKGHEGRTLYVGKTKNGKGLRCYEKGKQLQDYESKWVRFEVQFGNRDRVLPFDILVDPTRFFVAAYPALERLVECEGERIDTIQTTAAVGIATILQALKTTYGKWIHTLVKSGIEVTDLVEEISITAIPARVQAAAVVADVLSPTTKATFERWKNHAINC